MRVVILFTLLTPLCVLACLTNWPSWAMILHGGVSGLVCGRLANVITDWYDSLEEDE